VSRKQVVRTIVAHPTPINAVAFSPDGGRLIATAANDGVRLWDACSQSLLANIDAHQSPLLAIAFDRTGTRLVTTERDTSVDDRWAGQSRIWRLDPALVTQATEPQADNVLQFFTGADGEPVVVTVVNDRSIGYTDHRSATPRAVFQIPGGWKLGSAAVSGDGNILALGLEEATGIAKGGVPKLPDWRIDMVDVKASRALRSIALPAAPLGIASLALSRDGSRVAAGTSMEVRVWDVTSGSDVATVGRGMPPIVTFGRDRDDLAWTEPGRLIRYNLATKERAEFMFPTSVQPHSIAISGDGAVLAAAFSNRSVVLWHESSPLLTAVLSTGIGACVETTPTSSASMSDLPLTRSLRPPSDAPSPPPFMPPGAEMAAPPGMPSLPPPGPPGGPPGGLAPPRARSQEPPDAPVFAPPEPPAVRAGERGPMHIALSNDGARLSGVIGHSVKTWGVDLPVSLGQAVRESGSCWTGTELVRCAQPGSK
jgi:WD40 repeat protein